MNFKLLDSMTRKELVELLGDQQSKKKLIEKKVLDLESQRKAVTRNITEISSRLSRMKSKYPARSIETRFVDIARESLPDSIFSSILERAKENAYLSENDQ